MNRESIVKALKSSCGNKNFKFQVVIQNDRLHIYVNHKENYQPDYFLLQETVAEAIASLTLTSIAAVWLYTRPLGKVEPDWQTIVELPTTVQENAEDDDTIGTTQNQERETVKGSTTQNNHNDNLSLHRETVWQNSFPDRIELDAAKTGSAEAQYSPDNRVNDTGLLQDAGLIHGSPLSEEEMAISISLSEPKVRDAESNPEKDLTQYCFVVNKKLLTSDIIAPGKEIIRLVKFFHHLSDRTQQELLPTLEIYFQNKETPHLEQLSIAVQKWFRQIGELNDEDRQMFAIWLSRYCFDRSTTLEEFKTITARNAENATITKAKYRSTEYSFTPTNNKSSNLASKELDELNEKKIQLPPVVKKLILPSVWVLATVILLVLGIATNNPGSVLTAEQIPLCNNTIGSADYCRLAVNLAGARKIAKSHPSLFPLTEVTETVADYGCQRYTNLKAGHSPNIAPEQTPVVSSYGEKVFPHLYVVQVEQESVTRQENIKVGCVYTTGRGQRSPELLAADLIPTNWPQVSYQKQGSISGKLSLGRYTNPINLGLYTMFGALGIAIASWLNWGIEIERVQTVYLGALFLGFVQLIAASITALDLVGTIALLILTVLVANRLIPGFKINWDYGYLAIAVSILLIVAIQFLLYGLCLELIDIMV